MTGQTLLTAIKQLAERHIEKNTATPEAARASMIRKGIYGTNGRLAPEYGGEQPRPVARRR